MIIPNALAQNRAISYTAKGLFVDLISRPEEWRETCRQMADSSPQGRKSVEDALDELRAWGYYRVDVVRLSNGRLRSEAHLFDVPQRPMLPGADMPASGEPECGDPDALLGKNLVKDPSLPVAKELQAEEPRGSLAEEEQGGREDEPDSRTTANGGEEADEHTRAAAVVLLRAVRPERRLPLGEAEAVALAPLVRAWLDRGGSEEGLREALLAGLPGVIYSPARVVQSRLERKMPPSQRLDGPPSPRRRPAECAECRDPLPEPGLCPACAGTRRQGGPDEARARVTARGLAKVRAAMATGTAEAA
ncbi:hypothetical protein [Kitasatospora sp. NPDC059327]|uniref:hypothetical protein n=1 Tax=Kitasatospora sp. NPDC059327 TaxID=3346803 RepID=UPI003685E7A7